MKKSKASLAHLIDAFILLNSNRVAFNSKDFLVLPHLGYGDMIVCLPMFREMIRRGLKIQVISPAHAIPLLKQLCEGENVDFLAVEDFLSDEEYGTELMIDRARKFGRRHAKPVLFLGQDLWWLHSRIRPDIDLNTFFYRLGRIPI